MTIATSRITAQGQISVPAEVRRQLGVGSGSVLEWDNEEGKIVVRKAGRFSSEDVHQTLFSKRPRARGLAEMKKGIRQHIRKQHARR